MQASRPTRGRCKNEAVGSSAGEGRSLLRSTGDGEPRTLRHLDYNEQTDRIGSMRSVGLDHAFQAERIAQAIGRSFRVIARRIGPYEDAVEARGFVHLRFDAEHCR